MRAGEWIRIPGTAEWTRRDGDYCTLYVQPSGKLDRPFGRVRWTIYHGGTLLAEGHAVDEQSAKRGAVEASDEIDRKIRDAIRAMEIKRKAKTS